MTTPIFRLPPFSVQQRQTALSQTVPWNIALYGVPDHWRNTKGAGIKVGIADTGIIRSHPDLASNIAEVRDFTCSAFAESDRVGHGTHVAGTIAAANNDLGVVGVAPEAKLVIAKVLGDDGSGSGQSVAAGVEWLAGQGCQIISMSLGSPYEDAAIRAACKRAADAGIFVICAAGNDGQDDSINYPARWEFVVAVGAVDKQGKPAPFSSRGPQVDIAAPGVDILSTYPGGYASLSGTSMATPFVSGVTALLLARNPQAKSPVRNVAELLEHLRRTARQQPGSPAHDDATGWGLIDPAGMLIDANPEPIPEVGEPVTLLKPGLYRVQ